MKLKYKQFVFILVLLSAQWVGAAMPYPVDTIDGQAVYRYTVEKSIGLYRIGINFNVSQDEIIQMNPELKERGLRYGEVIYIPVKEEKVEEVLKVEGVLKVEEVPNTDTIVVVDSVVGKDSTGFHLAVLLPLQADQPKRDAMAARFMEFYEGVLVALKMLPDTNHIYLHVYDIGRTDNLIKELIANGELAKMNAILGPSYPAQVSAVAPLALADSIPTIIPFTNKVIGIENNPFLFQFNPSIQAETQAVGDYLEAHKEQVHCVLVDMKEADIPYAIREIRQEIRNRDISSSRISMHDLLQDSLASALEEGKDNIIFLNTEKYANAQLFFSHIIQGKGGHSVTLFSQYAWQEEKILLPQLYTCAFAAEPSERMAQYEQVYNHYFHHEHASIYPRYDLLGFDLTNYLIAWLRGDESHGVQSEIVFEQLPNNGGYINTHVQVVRK